MNYDFLTMHDYICDSQQEIEYFIVTCSLCCSMHNSVFHSLGLFQIVFREVVTISIISLPIFAYTVVFQSYRKKNLL